MKKILVSLMLFSSCYIHAIVKRKLPISSHTKQINTTEYQRTRDILRKNAPKFKSRNPPFTISTL